MRARKGVNNFSAPMLVHSKKRLVNEHDYSGSRDRQTPVGAARLHADVPVRRGLIQWTTDGFPSDLEMAAQPKTPGRKHLVVLMRHRLQHHKGRGCLQQGRRMVIMWQP